MWVVLAAIAITGFAAFDAGSEAEVPAPPGNAGRSDVVGLAPSALFDFAAVAGEWSDPPIPPAPVPPEPAPTTTTAPPSTAPPSRRLRCPR